MKITVVRTGHPQRPWTVSCACGELHVSASDDELSMIIPIHWRISHEEK